MSPFVVPITTLVVSVLSPAMGSVLTIDSIYFKFDQFDGTVIHSLD